LKHLIKRIPVVGNLAVAVNRALRGKSVAAKDFQDSGTYWETRYKTGGNSGAGSYGKLSIFKSEVINGFVKDHDVKSVIEFGCGDGNQLTLADYKSYMGFDVSETAISACRSLFKRDNTKSFHLMSDYRGQKAELGMSLDVIYHLVEDATFNAYMKTLFDASNRFVIIYSSDKDAHQSQWTPHVRHRKFSSWITENLTNWSLLTHVPNRHPGTGELKDSSFADFYIYQRI
jgi:SAM-dependent methyltransferase